MFAQMNVYDKYVMFLISMALSLLISSLFIWIYQVWKEKSTINKIEKRVSKEERNYIYYREILKGYSPASLAYCYNRKTNLEDIIVATLLDLQRRNKIKIEDYKIILDTNIKDMDIAEYEKEILLHCINEKKTTKEVLLQKIKEETEKQKLIKQGDNEKLNSTYIMELIMAWLIIYHLVILVILVELSSIGLLLLASYALTFLSIPAYKAIQAKISFIVRNKNGLEISAKLRGLKKYIKEFSNIQDGTMQDIKLFDDYVIYAIILNLQGKLNKEARALYNKFKL